MTSMDFDYVPQCAAPDERFQGAPSVPLAEPDAAADARQAEIEKRWERYLRLLDL